MKEYSNVCAIVPNNFAHKAGDGLSTRKHHLKAIHPALQANCGGTQMTYILLAKQESKKVWNFFIIE